MTGNVYIYLQLIFCLCSFEDDNEDTSSSIDEEEQEILNLLK